MKMPEPMIPPITIIVASKSPSRRASVPAGSFKEWSGEETWLRGLSEDEVR